MFISCFHYLSLQYFYYYFAHNHGQVSLLQERDNASQCYVCNHVNKLWNEEDIGMLLIFLSEEQRQCERKSKRAKHKMRCPCEVREWEGNIKRNRNEVLYVAYSSQ